MSKKIARGIVTFILAGILVLGGLPGLQNYTTVTASASQLGVEMVNSHGQDVFSLDNNSDYYNQIMNSNIASISVSDTVYNTSDFIGIWEGEYDGNLGPDIMVPRHIIITIDSCESENAISGTISGTLQLFPSEVEDSPYGATGSYYFSGTVHFQSGWIRFKGNQWIENPGEWEFLEFSGYLKNNKKEITGVTNGYGESTFYLNRIGTADGQNMAVIMTKDGVQYDLLKGTPIIEKGSSEKVTISVLPNWDGAEPGTIRICQGEKVLERISGVFADIMSEVTLQNV